MILYRVFTLLFYLLFITQLQVQVTAKTRSHGLVYLQKYKLKKDNRLNNI